MREFRQVLWGVVIALISAGIIMGSLSVALIEGGMSAVLVGTPTFVVRLVTQPIPSIFPTLSSRATGTTAVMLSTPLSVTSSPITASPSATPRCQSPAGWARYEIKPGDTLASIAAQYNITEEALASANCLEISNIMPGTYLYVPNVYPTTAVVQCGPPRGWVFYTVKPGDNLYRIAIRYGTTVEQLQFANCLGNSILIRIGQRLYVPNVPTITPDQIPDTRTPTQISTSTPTVMPDNTATATRMPTQLPSSTFTATGIPTAVPTSTSTPTNMSTATSTATNVPTAIPTQTPTSTSTETSVPTTQAATSTATGTALPPTATGTALPATATATETGVSIIP